MSIHLVWAALTATVGDDERHDVKRRVSAQARKLVLIKMCDNAADDGTGIMCSQRTLAAAAEVDVRTVREVLASLRQSTLIILVDEAERGGHGGGRPAVWIVNVEALWQLPVETDTEGHRGRLRGRHRPDISSARRPDMKGGRPDTTPRGDRTLPPAEPPENHPLEPSAASRKSNRIPDDRRARAKERLKVIKGEIPNRPAPPSMRRGRPPTGGP